MLESARDFALNVAAVAGMFVALGACAKIPIVNRPGKWLITTLITAPVTRLHHRSLDDWAEAGLRPAMNRIEHEMRTNDGSSLRDVADRVERSTARIEQRLNAGEQRFATIESHLGIEHPATVTTTTTVATAVTTPHNPT